MSFALSNIVTSMGLADAVLLGIPAQTQAQAVLPAAVLSEGPAHTVSFPTPRVVPAVPASHAALSRWVALSGESAEKQQELSELSLDIAHQFQSCERRWNVLQTQYLSQFTDESQQHEWQRLTERLEINRQGR